MNETSFEPKSVDGNRGWDSTSRFGPGVQGVDLRSVTAARIVGGVFAAVAIAGSIVGLLFLWLSGLPTLWPLLATGTTVVLILPLCWAVFYWPVVEHRHIYWRCSDTGIEISHGVFWKHKIAIPWARVQHADVSQGPLQRIFELGSLTIHTAGTKNASVSLDGLSHDTALQLRDEVIQQRKVGDVV